MWWVQVQRVGVATLLEDASTKLSKGERLLENLFKRANQERPTAFSSLLIVRQQEAEPSVVYLRRGGT